jgi:ribosome maturation factor RimP
MTQSPLAASVADLAAPLAASLGLELWGIELAFGGRGVVRVFVEGENGVSIEQCAELSRLLGVSLDVEDCIPGAYVLEVSSPGLERTFFTENQLARALGQRVEITLRSPRPAWPGRRKFRGRLRGVPAAGDERGPLPGEAGPELAACAAQGDRGEAASGDAFILEAEDMARPGDDAPLVAFTFADLKKAVQIHFAPAPALPGKAAAGKKPSRQKSAKSRAQENSDAAG